MEKGQERLTSCEEGRQQREKTEKGKAPPSGTVLFQILQPFATTTSSSILKLPLVKKILAPGLPHGLVTLGWGGE